MVWDIVVFACIVQKDYIVAVQEAQLVSGVDWLPSECGGMDDKKRQMWIIYIDDMETHTIK